METKLFIVRSLIFLLCLVASIPLRFLNRKSRVPKLLVVIQMAKLGDMVCTTPIFRAIKKENPVISLTVLGNSINKEVLSGNKDVDKYIVFSDLFGTYRRLREGNFDTAILVEPDFVSAALAYLTGIPKIIVPKIVGGYSPFESTYYRILRKISRMTVVQYEMGKYAPREYLRILEPLGIFSYDTAKHLFYSIKSDEKVKNFLHSNDIKEGDVVIGVSPSSGNKIKAWGEVKFAELIVRLYKTYRTRIIVIGGLRDREEVEKTLSLIPKYVPVINVLEKFSIDELKALISKLNLFVAVDTGPIYIAEAFGVPTVDIVGPMDEREQPPIGKIHAVVMPPFPREPALHVMNAKGYDHEEARRQADSITVGMVFRACEKVISRAA